MWTVTIHLDLELPELAISLSAPLDATVSWVKSELCKQTIGASQLEDFWLCTLANPQVPLNEDTVLCEDLQTLLIHTDAMHQDEAFDDGSRARVDIACDEDAHDMISPQDRSDGFIIDPTTVRTTLEAWLKHSDNACGEHLEADIFVDGAIAKEAARRAESEAQRRLAIETSRKRIASAGALWYKVLGVAPSASAADVKKAFRQLALLHHPDKSLDNVEDITFKQILKAYEDSLCHHKVGGSYSKASSTNDGGTSTKSYETRRSQAPRHPPKESKKAKGTKAEKQHEAEPAGYGYTNYVHVPSKRWVICDGASKTEIKDKMNEWQNRSDMEDGVSKTLPIHIKIIEGQELWSWMEQSACTVIDTREIADQRGPCLGPAMSYSTLLFRTEVHAQQLLSLRRNGKHVVLCSDRGRRVGTCGLFGCILVDIFGFDIEKVRCMDGGLRVFRTWVANNLDLFFAGSWLYGKKPTKYSITRSCSGELRIECPHANHGMLFGDLRYDCETGWLNAELQSSISEICGMIRLHQGFGGTIVSSFKGVSMKDWGSDIIAKREIAAS